jgi:hypothetical protein
MVFSETMILINPLTIILTFVCGFFVGTIAILYLTHGYYYSKGMSIYAIFNNTRPTFLNDFSESESCWGNIVDEFFEMIHAIKQCQFMETFNELLDVCHAIVKFLSIKCLPQFVYTSKIYWSFLFYINLPVSLKLGSRYRDFGCIRNHKNPKNRKHFCKWTIDKFKKKC